MASLEMDARRILESSLSHEGPLDQYELADFVTQNRATLLAGLEAGIPNPLGLTAFVWASLELDALDEARAWLDSTDLLKLVGEAITMPRAEKSQACAIIAQCELLSADLPRAATAARMALRYAAGRETMREASLANGLSAMAFALNGEMTTARDFLDKADAAAATAGEAANSHWPTEFARIAIDIRGDGAALAAHLAAGPQWASENGTLRGYEAYRDAAGRLIRGDFKGAQSRCSAYRSRLDYDHTPELFKHLLLSTECLALSQLGRPGKVLELLKDKQSPPNHAICYNLLRGGAHMMLGNPERALREFAHCLDMDAAHSGTTRASVLLREAVAREQLGQHDAADAAFYKASQLADLQGAAVPPLGLPLEVLEVLSVRMAQADPDLSASIADSLEGRPYRDAPVMASEQPKLSAREMELVRNLASGKTFAQIARESFLSVSTLKTQASSVYKKLGVRSRHEAVARMKDVGFFT